MTWYNCLLVSALLVSCAALSATSVRGPFRVVHGWPRLPEGFAFGQVTAVDVDSRGRIWVLHRGDPPVMCLSAETGEVITSFGSGLFDGPHGLTVDSRDTLWITDTTHHQVFRFNFDGQLLMALGTKGVAGLDATHFDKPTAVAVLPGGEFYVADGYGNSRVVKFSADGKFLFDWGSKGNQPGQFDAPHGITVDSQGRVYVADRGNARIQVFDGNGKFLHEWKSEALGRPWGVAVGPDGFLYVVDGGDARPKPPERNRAMRLDLNGNILETWGSFGSYDGQFYWAHDIVAAKNGDVYVTDVNVGMRVQKFSRNSTAPGK